MSLQLDSTAGYRIMWKDKDTRNIVFIDKRLECKPDIVCDARQLPFRDRVFNKIICDPPHIIRERVKNKGKGGIEERLLNFARLYSSFKTRTSWLSFLHNTNKEYKRTIVENGELIYKITDSPYKETPHLTDVIQYMTNFHLKSDNSHPTKSHNTTNRTHWLTLTLT